MASRFLHQTRLHGKTLHRRLKNQILILMKYRRKGIEFTCTEGRITAYLKFAKESEQNSCLMKSLQYTLYVVKLAYTFSIDGLKPKFIFLAEISHTSFLRNNTLNKHHFTKNS